MTALVVGAVLGVGVLLAASPWLWPRSAHDTRGRARDSAIAARLAQAGLGRVPPLAFIALSLLLALVAGAIAIALSTLIVVGIVAAVLGGLAPWVAIGATASRRSRSRSKLWPDLVDHLGSSIRAGRSLPDSIAALADALPVAFAEPFDRFAASTRRGADWDTTLDDLKADLADPTADRILETLRMARQVGGTELGSVLRRLSESLRQQAAIRAELEARQSWVYNAARIGVAAPWLVLLLLAARPEAATAYNSVAGAMLILGVAIISVIAYRLMLRIGRLPEERRWFA